MDWISDLVTEKSEPVKQQQQQKTEQRKTEKQKPKVETVDAQCQTGRPPRKNKACQVYTAKRNTEMPASEQLRIMQGFVGVRRGIVSNLGALRDEDHEQDELRQEQLQQLEDQFNFKICSLQQELEKQAAALRTREDEHKKSLEDSNKRVEKLQRQLDDSSNTEARLQEILANYEKENAHLIQLHKEKADLHSTFSPAVLATLKPDEPKGKVEVKEKFIATAPVDIIQFKEEREIPKEKLHSPFKDRPFIKTYYDHPTEAIEASRRELENELAIRTLNIAACPIYLTSTNQNNGSYLGLDISNFDIYVEDIPIFLSIAETLFYYNSYYSTNNISLACGCSSRLDVSLYFTFPILFSLSLSLSLSPSLSLPS
eukprot:sb/3465833/